MLSHESPPSPFRRADARDCLLPEGPALRSGAAQRLAFIRGEYVSSCRLAAHAHFGSRKAAAPSAWEVGAWGSRLVGGEEQGCRWAQTGVIRSASSFYLASSAREVLMIHWRVEARPVSRYCILYTETDPQYTLKHSE